MRLCRFTVTGKDADAVVIPSRYASLAAGLSLLLAVLSAAAAPADPATVKGRFTYGGKVYVLQHVYAWQPPFQGEELWIYVTDNPLPPAAAQHDSLPEQLAREKRFGGVKLIVRPVQPRREDMKGVVYAPREDGYSVDTFNFGPTWQRLTVENQRVAGKIASKWMNWTLDVEFSAPVLGSTGKVQTIAGAKAQGSAQADVFLAFEQALVERGLDAAAAYMTPEMLGEMRAKMQRLGAASFKEFQAKRRASTPVGEARRKQIEWIDFDGDYARLGAGAAPDKMEIAILARTKDGWKIAEW